MSQNTLFDGVSSKPRYRKQGYNKEWRKINEEHISTYNKKNYEERRRSQQNVAKQREANRAWARLNRDKVRENGRRWRKQNREYLRGIMRQKKYGITPEEFAAMMVGQDSKCLICEVVFSHSGEANIDHDHATGLIRGLLCKHCNHAIGHMRDSSDRLRRAAIYLDRCNARRVDTEINPFEEYEVA